MNVYVSCVCVIFSVDQPHMFTMYLLFMRWTLSSVFRNFTERHNFIEIFDCASCNRSIAICKQLFVLVVQRPFPL